MVPKGYALFLSTVLIFLVSCSGKEKFPEIKFERVDSDAVKFNHSFNADTDKVAVSTADISKTETELDKLLKYKAYYIERDKRFDLQLFEREWAGFNIYEHRLSQAQLMEWIESTGYLLELTEDTKYAEALEDLIYETKLVVNDDIANLLKSFIYTKYVDHIHLNMFVNSTIEYNHSMEGTIKITQDNNYPESGKLTVKFNITEHPFVELFIRIPSWAKGATVTALSVKYVATPGEYCQIARKWKDGDTVEINLPVELRPEN